MYHSCFENLIFFLHWSDILCPLALTITAWIGHPGFILFLPAEFDLPIVFDTLKSTFFNGLH